MLESNRWILVWVHRCNTLILYRRTDLYTNHSTRINYDYSSYKMSYSENYFEINENIEIFWFKNEM